MSDRLKITIIGGGSYAWTPTIFRDLVVTDELRGATVCLHDLDPRSLADQTRLARKIVKASCRNFRVSSTTSRKTALTDADFVILTISTGGLDAMRHDIDIPRKYGIYQPVGDTVGPGGLARALRNIPVVLQIGRDMERFCPQAWMINYTNPMTTLCRALTRFTSVRTIGLCHELLETFEFLGQLFGVPDREDFKASVAGVNHCPWIIDLKVRGLDGFELLRRYLADPKSFKPLSKPSRKSVETTHPESLIGSHKVKFALFEAFGALPAAADRHVSEFFPHFLTNETHAGADWGVKLTTIEDRREKWLPAAKNRTYEMIKGTRPISLERSGEAASLLIAALAGRRPPFIDVMNLPNQGQVPDLPTGVCVETMAVADSLGTRGLAVGHLPPGVLNSVLTHVFNQEMIVEAGLTGDRNLALQALLNDPLIHDFDDAKQMLDEMLRANRRWLPQF